MFYNVNSIFIKYLCQIMSVTEVPTATMAGMKVLMRGARYVLATISSVVQTIWNVFIQVIIYLKFYYFATEPCCTFSVLKLQF